MYNCTRRNKLYNWSNSRKLRKVARNVLKRVNSCVNPTGGGLLEYLP